MLYLIYGHVLFFLSTTDSSKLSIVMISGLERDGRHAKLNLKVVSIDIYMFEGFIIGTYGAHHHHSRVFLF